MKTKINQLIKIGILTMGISLFFLTSCEKDNNVETQQESKYRIETIDYKQLESNQKIISQLDKLGLNPNKNNANNLSKNIYYSNLGFTIQTDSIKHVFDTETGIHSFNFSIVRDSMITNNLENLLLQSNEQDDEYDSFIVEYGFTNDQLGSLDETLLNNTTTKYTPIEFDTSIFNNNELAKSDFPELVCVEVWVFTTVPNDQGNLNGDTPVFTQEWILESSSCTWTSGGGGGSGSTDGGSDGSGNTSGGTTGGGGTGSGGGGKTSTPVGIQNNENPCDPAPEGDLNGDCMLDYYEACLLNGYSEDICNCTIDGTDISTCIVKDCLGDSYILGFEQLSSTDKTRVSNYLYGNCSGESQGFALSAIEALQINFWTNEPNGEVDFENEIIKDASFIGTKEDCVLNELINDANNLFRDISNIFTDDKSKFKLKFTTFTENSAAVFRTSPPNENGIVEIKLNLNQANGRSIDIAASILHEAIHAELHRIYVSNNAPPYNYPADRFDWLKRMYEIYHNITPRSAVSTAQHFYMAQYCIDPLTNAIREYDQFTQNANSYKFLAWDGLQVHGIELNNITQSELDNLENLTISTVYNDNYESECNN